CQHYNGFPFTF
nr:immunoglobulin light chain junction region [Macaca mulatta]MOW13664.1 immunoglobulin light chain junction region [Macaca mulatta]